MNIFVELCTNMFDALCSIIFVTLFCKISFRKIYFSIPATLIIFAVSTFFSFVNAFSVVHSIIITAILYAYCFLCKTKDRVRLIFAPIIFEITLIIINSTFLTLFSYIFNLDLITLMISGSIARYLLIIICKTLTVSILLIILKVSSFTTKFSSVNLILYLVSPIFTVYILYMFIDISQTYDLREFTGMIITSIICLAIINVFTIILFEVSNKNAESKRKYDLLQHQICLERENYQGMINASENLHKVKHDIKNHLIYIRKIIDSNDFCKAEEYIEKITNDMQDTEKYMVTGNRTLDYILSSKISENKNITFICAGECFSVLNYMDELDVAILFGNLLDNAIEALENEAEKSIEIRISLFNSICNIHISNPFTKSILENNSKLKTTKKNSAEHGWGLRSVKSVVEKYSGLFDYYEKNNKFTVHVSIPIKTNE